MFRTDTQHALRALTVLAETEERLPIGVLAERAHAPAPMLAKVLHRLSLLGFVAGRPGRGGGYRLARPAARLRLSELIGAFEGPAFARACLFGLAECSDVSPCPLHSVWAGARGGLLRLVDACTVADLAGDAGPRRATTDLARDAHARKGPAR